LGLVLYEMCTGERAFRGSTSADVRHSILYDEYRPVSEVNRSIPPHLSKVVGRCLEKDPSRRYQSAKELRSDLESIRREFQGSATPRPQLQWLAAAAVVVLIVGMGVLTFFRASGKAPKEQPFRARRSVAVLGFRNLSGASDQDWISTALVEMLSSELDAGGQLRVVNGEEVAHMKLNLSIPTANSYSPQTLARIREQLGADDVIFGSFLRSPGKSDSSLRLDLRVQSATGGETVAALTTNGTEAELPDLVVRATSALRDKLGIAAPSTAESSQAKSSLPSNSQALRLYSEGLERLRVFDALAARKYLEDAVAADPQNALSHSWLAESLYSLGYESKASEEAKKGFELSRSLPRPEQLLVEGRYRDLSHDYPAAVDIYRSLWKFFPDDIEAGLRVANMQNKSGSAKDALRTIADLHNLTAPANEDPRIDIAEANVRDSLADFNGSEKAAASAIEKAQRSGARLLLAQAKECDARAWDRLGQVDKSSREFAEARDLSLEGGNPRVVAYALNGIANGLYDKGDFEGARKGYEQALETARRIGALKDVASFSTNIGNVFFEQGKLPEARKLYEESLRVDRDIGNERNRASDLGSIGNVMQGMGDLGGALRMQEQSLQAFRNSGDRRGEASTLNNIGNVLSELGQLELAESKYEEAMVVQQVIGYRRGRGYSLVSTADILRLQNHLSEARAKAEEALNLRREIGDNTNLAYSEMELANINLDQSNFSEAESLATQAAEAFRSQKVADAGCQAEAILSRALLAQAKLAAAEAAASRALSLCRQGSDRDARFEAYLASAEVSAQAGRRSEALKELNVVQSESKRYGYLVYEIRARLQLAELEFSAGRSESGRAGLAQVARDAQAHGLGLILQKTKSLHG
jgi:tetratricopeptide (TPR) repeat protein